MGFCPANCASIDLMANPDGGCETVRRKRSLYKIGFYSCSETLPSPLTCSALQTLVASNGVVWSSPLVNVEWADPTMEDVVVSDCLPASSEAIGRTLTFEDHIALDILPGTSGAPEGNEYADLKFWGNKNKIGISLRYLFLWCDGVIDIPVDQFGKPMGAGFNVFRAFSRQGSGGTSYVLEIKKGTINFKGDPLELTEDYEPALVIDASDEECTALAASLGLTL